MTEKLFKEIMKRSKLRNIFLRNRTEVNKIFYNRQRNYCVSLLWKSKKGYGENQKQPPRCSVKKGVLRNFAKFTGKHLCQRLFFDKGAGLRPNACNFIKKQSLAQVFPCEFCEISKNTFFYRTPPVAASVIT